jgi:hypothetical protein
MRPALSAGCRFVSLIAFPLLALVPLRAADAPPPVSPFAFYGDLRVRYEWDWDSQTPGGIPRDDRERARVRARLGFTCNFSAPWSVGARVRTGNKNSQQSPHLTFYASDDATDDFSALADRYFLQYKQDGVTAWGGRNVTPFWQPDEIFWDEDVTPTGIAGSFENKVDYGTVTTTVGAFYLPDGAVHLNGTLFGGQVKWVLPIQPSQLTVATGLYQFDGRDGAQHLLNRNGARNYTIGVLAAQWTTPVAGRIPLSLAADLLKNFQNYDSTDLAPYGARQADETNGYVFSVSLGQLKQARDWQVALFYAHIETFAVNASYSQDDWARWGAGPQALVTDFEGFEFRAAYAFTRTLNLMVRFFDVDAITSVQDGKRCRVDLNWKF